jgi:hypothetical protein
VRQDGKEAAVEMLRWPSVADVKHVDEPVRRPMARRDPSAAQAIGWLTDPACPVSGVTGMTSRPSTVFHTCTVAPLVATWAPFGLKATRHDVGLAFRVSGNGGLGGIIRGASRCSVRRSQVSNVSSSSPLTPICGCKPITTRLPSALMSAQIG